MTTEVKRDTAESSLHSLSGELVALIQTIVAEAIGTATGTPTAKTSAKGFDLTRVISSTEFRAEINNMMEQAFQTVLPQLIKRFKAEIDQRLSETDSSSSKIVNSEEMKELLDNRFRQMMLFLKQDVIPKAVEQKLAVA